MNYYLTLVREQQRCSQANKTSVGTSVSTTKKNHNIPGKFNHHSGDHHSSSWVPTPPPACSPPCDNLPGSDECRRERTNAEPRRDAPRACGAACTLECARRTERNRHHISWLPQGPGGQLRRPASSPMSCRHPSRGAVSDLLKQHQRYW